jgi:hypothetical protein
MEVETHIDTEENTALDEKLALHIQPETHTESPSHQEVDLEDTSKTDVEEVIAEEQETEQNEASIQDIEEESPVEESDTPVDEHIPTEEEDLAAVEEIEEAPKEENSTITTEDVQKDTEEEAATTEDVQEDTEEETPAEEETDDFTFPMVTPLAQESSLIDNRMLGIRANKYGLQRNKTGVSNPMLASYHLFNPIRIEGEKEIELEPPYNEHQEEMNSNEAEVAVTEESVTASEDSIPAEESVEKDTVEKTSIFNNKNNFIFHGPHLKTNPSTSSELHTVKEAEEDTSVNQEEAAAISDEQKDRLKELEKQLEKYPLKAPPLTKKKLPNLDELMLHATLENDQIAGETEDELDNKSESKTEQTEEDNEQPETHHDEENFTSEEENHNSPTLLLDRDIRLRKKFSFHQLHQETTEQTIEPVKREKTTKNNVEEEEQTTKKPDVFPLEPFSSRRRNKKSRLFSTLESTIPNPLVQPSPTQKNEKAFSNLVQDSIIPNELDENPSDSDESDADQTNALEEQPNNVETNSDNLKFDNIEFEEPYGYNSFEDFFPSFSNTNDRKRQEMDKIEKRKIALRGLHNLINNLG